MLKYAAFIVGFVAISGVSAEARISANGVSLNGVSTNRISANGISLNGTNADRRAPDARIGQSGTRVISVETRDANGRK